MPIFKSIVETLVKFEQELVDVVKHVLSIRGLKPAEQKNIVKKGQAEIWGEVHGSLSHHLEKVASPHYS